MDLVSLFIKSIIVGLSVSIPLGPIGVLCIQRTINKGRISGIFSGMGAATSDTFYAAVAGFSLTYVIDFIDENSIMFQIFGAVLLIFLGGKIFYTNPAHQLRKQRRKGNNLFGDFISTFFLTVSNPLYIIIFIGVFTGFGLVEDISKTGTTSAVVSGVFLGAMAWWFILTSVVNLFRSKINLRRLWWINKITGVAIVVFAVVTFVYLMTK